MGIDVKDVKICIGKVVGFTMNICRAFVQKHPLASVVMLTSFFLYLFLPSIFNFLLYSSPIIMCTIAYGYFYLNTKDSATRGCGKNDHQGSSLDSKAPKNDLANKDNKPFMRSQLSVRRNVTKRYQEWEAEGSKDEHDMVTSYEGLIGGTFRAEEKPKEVTEEGCSLHRGESSSCNVSATEKIQAVGDHRPIISPAPSMVDLVSFNRSTEQLEKFSTGGGEVDSDSSGEDDDEDEIHDGNKAVEWTEDDQKNLMDLGDSEIERNRRLESLIAKRRARKLLKFQVEKGLQPAEGVPPSQIAPIFVARSNPFENPNNYSAIDSLDTPGSAPSILLPTRNPFDLPYEPHEEKPNLMADSFHQEFTAAHQKEMFFCRHESFSLGPSFPFEPKRGWHDSRFGPNFGIENRTTDRPPHPRFRKQSNSGDIDQLAEISSQESEAIHDTKHSSDVVRLENKAQNVKSVEFKHKEHGKADNGKIESKGEQAGNAFDKKSSLENGTEVEMEMNSAKDNNSESSSPSSSEDRGEIFNPGKSSFSENLRQRVMFRQDFNNPTEQSFACPIPTGLHVSEPLYYSGPLPTNKSKMEERSFYTNKRTCHTPTYSIASDMLVEVSEVSSPPGTLDEVVSSPDRESLTYDGDIDKDHDSGSEDMWGASFNSRSRVANEVLEEATAEGGFSSDNKKSEDPMTSSMLPQHVPEQDLNNNASSPITKISEQVQSQSENLDNMTSNDVKQVMEGVREHRSFNSPDALSVREPENRRQLTGDSLAPPPHEAYSEKQEDISNPPAKSAEQATIIEHVDDPVAHESDDMEDLSSMENRDNEALIPIKQEAGDELKPAEEIVIISRQPSENVAIFESKNKNSNLTEGIERDPENATESKVLEDVSSQVEGEDNIRSIQDSINEQNFTEVGVSGVNQISNDLGASSVQSELAVEQVPVISSSSSSPTSVLQLQRLPSDQISFSNVDHQRHIDFPQSSAEDIMRSDPTDEQTLQNLFSTLHQPDYSVAEKLEELTDTQGMSTEKVNMVNNMCEPLFHEKSSEEDFSVNTNEDESKKLISSEVAQETSKNAEESNPASAESGNVKDLAVHGPVIGPSKAEEENTSSDVHGTAGADEELRNLHGKVIEEANIISQSNDPTASEEEAKERPKFVQGSEDETQFSIRHETTLEPKKPAEAMVSQVSDNTPKSCKENESSSTTKNDEQLGEVVGRQDASHPPTSADDRGNSASMIDAKSGSEKL